MSDRRTGRVRQAGAVAVRNRDGVTEVLIVRAKKDPSHWIFPKGHIELGESEETAAARELKEEAGVIGSIGPRLGVLSFESGKEQVEVAYYLARFTGTVPTSEGR